MLESLLRAGAKVYIYQNGFLHTKMIVIDDEASTVGTANIDVRSFKLNFEVNAFIYDRDNFSSISRDFRRRYAIIHGAYLGTLPRKIQKNYVQRINCKVNFANIIKRLPLFAETSFFITQKTKNLYSWAVIGASAFLNYIFKYSSSVNLDSCTFPACSTPI